MINCYCSRHRIIYSYNISFYGGVIMKYISAKEAANKWGVSQRRVATLCSQERIPGAEMVGNMWLIPKDENKPKDGRSLRYMKKRQLKPFVKWAGGKGQLLRDIRGKYPEELGDIIIKYSEPFVGGGAILFDILSNFDLKQVYISDVNEELINTYIVIRDDVEKLISLLFIMQSEYISANTENRKKYYYVKRERFNFLKVNLDKSLNIEKAALFIFLNKTCFNGLYRVNRKGFFNVPMGAYKNPRICDDDNLRNISLALLNVKIVCGDYKESERFIDEKTFVYIDPPYRPITETASFTAYTEKVFDDKAQIELAEYVTLLDKKGAMVIVSNSDPKNTNIEDEFFDELYNGHKISRVQATRMINSNGTSRGKISELLIVNY